MNFLVKENYFLDLKGPHANTIQQLIDCLHCNLPVLLVTDNAQRTSKMLSVLANLSNQKLKRILLNERSDTTQLLGCFEQTSSDANSILASITYHKYNPSLTASILKLEHDCRYKECKQVLTQFCSQHE